jgi:hypothetical protein
MNNTTEASAQPIVPAETEVKVSTVDTSVDLEARNTALEAEKSRLIEEAANYKMAYLKEKKRKESEDDEPATGDDDRLRKIAREELANSRLSEIAVEQDAIIQKALKENKELKLAQMNRQTSQPSAAIGTHSESQPVRDTLITPEQMTAFKARGWTDKDIERYKKNLNRFK